jgi:hypothetical protein
MSQTYIFYDQAGTIPGIPDMFSHCIVEVGDDGQVAIRPLPGGQNALVIDGTLEPVGFGEITSEGIQPIETLEPVAEQTLVEAPATEPIQEQEQQQEV